MIHGHGDDFYKSAAEVRANFSTNVWYEADNRPLCDFLTAHLERMFHYPEPDAASFRRVAAAYHGVEVEQVVAGNGATELFYLVAHAFAGSRTSIPVPSFTEYEDACALYRHQIRFEETDEADLMFICNPNNPDGRIWRLEEIERLLQCAPQRLLVVDESFLHFAPEAVSALTLLERYANLVVVKSMTKCYAIPGLRLGYMIGRAELIERMAAFRQPWSVNALAIEAGKYLLQEGAAGLPDAVRLKARQEQFAQRMAAIPGFRPQPSGTSFFLVETDYDSGELKRRLFEEHGLLIRDASNFRGLNRHYFRVNTLTEEKNGWLLDALMRI